MRTRMSLENCVAAMFSELPRASAAVEQRTHVALHLLSIAGNEVEVAIIPHTYAATSLHTLTPGAPLNIEVDVLSKYAERQQTEQEKFILTEEYLIANGY